MTNNIIAIKLREAVVNAPADSVLGFDPRFADGNYLADAIKEFDLIMPSSSPGFIIALQAEYSEFRYEERADSVRFYYGTEHMLTVSDWSEFISEYTQYEIYSDFKHEIEMYKAVYGLEAVIIYKCAHCNDLFEPSFLDQEFCDDKCAVAHYE